MSLTTIELARSRGKAVLSCHAPAYQPVLTWSRRFLAAGLTQREQQALRDRGFTPAEIEFLNGLEEINHMVRESSGNGQPQLWNAHCPPKARASELGPY